jgi:uncharacterized protein with von Willebrand factor type A (vWA) domain
MHRPLRTTGRRRRARQANTGLQWLYDAYDGGMDVMQPSIVERDALRDRHRDWLLAHPAGLSPG